MEVGIGGQGHMPIGVPGATGDGASVHPAGDQLGDHEVAQVMQAGMNAQLGRQHLEAVRDPIGADGGAAVRRPGEHVGLRRQAPPRPAVPDAP